MKTLQHTQLRFTDGKSDKIYEVDLCEQSNSNDERFLVNFRYGRYGKKLREGTKTTDPVTHEKAIKIFDSLVVAKVNKGYHDTSIGNSQENDSLEDSLDSDSNLNSFTPLETNSAKNTILNYLHNPPENWALSRIVWRAGDFDLQEAGDRIVQIAESAKKLTDDKDEAFLLRYSCLWALAHCGKDRHISAIKNLKGDKRTKQLNLSVQLMLADDKSLITNELLTQLPKNLVEIIRTDNLQALVAELKNSSKQHKIKKIDRSWWTEQHKYFLQEHLDIIITVYQLSYALPICKTAILQLLNEQQVNEPQDNINFNFVKKLFKFSELYRDGETFAKCLQLIENYQPVAYSWYSDDECSDNFDKSDIDYHRRRSWRALRKLAEADNMAYIDFAEAILLSVNDNQAKQPQTVTFYSYDYDTWQSIEHVKHYGKFPELLAFNNILYKHSKHHTTTNGLKWFINKDEQDTGRTEAFSQLWDKVPERLLNLLLQAQCEDVHQFATTALAENSEFCAELADNRVQIVEQLLASQYDITAKFALELAKTAYQKTQSFSLLKACLNSSYLPAKQQAVEWLQANPSLLKTDYPLFAKAIFYSQATPQLTEIFAQIDFNNLENGREQNELINAVIDETKQRDKVNAELIKHVLAQLLTLAKEGINNLAINKIDELLSQTSEHCQLFGALLLLENNIAIADIPSDLLAKINQSNNEEVQATAITLLQKLTDEELLAKYHALLSFVVSTKQPVRQAVRPVLERLADNSEFTSRLLADLVPYSFRAEPVEGFHDDLLALFSTTLHSAVANLDTKLRWRLLNAQSKLAKKLGALQLDKVSVESYSVKQWALLGGNEMLAVRQKSWQIYRDNVAVIKANMNDALRLLNNKWDDSRAFALDYFRTQLADDDWTAELIVSVCDNTYDDVQLLGRELLTRCFKEGDGVQYLMKLSQHPTQNVQLFTTNFLADYACDNVERLQQLKPYFITVLSQVYKGRVAKNRVIKFLNAEALKDEMVARLVADIYTRQSVTIAVTDKAQYIEGMQDLRAKYPSLNLPIQVKELAVKGKSRRGVSSVLESA